MGIQGITRGYRGLQGVTRGYKGLQGVTRGYKGLQRVTRGYKDYPLCKNANFAFFLSPCLYCLERLVF